MKRYLLFMLLIGALSGCTDRPDKNVTDVSKQQDHVADINDFSKTDSLELIYYPDPSDQKVYTFHRTSDTNLIKLLAEDLSADSVARIPCAHYQKIYLFDKGEVYKTIYVSDSCNYLAFVVNGQRQFRNLSPATREGLMGEGIRSEK